MKYQLFCMTTEKTSLKIAKKSTHINLGSNACSSVGYPTILQDASNWF